MVGQQGLCVGYAYRDCAACDSVLLFMGRFYYLGVVSVPLLKCGFLWQHVHVGAGVGGLLFAENSMELKEVTLQ